MTAASLRPLVMHFNVNFRGTVVNKAALPKEYDFG